MNNQMVAHNWANQTNKGQRGSNFFYDGKSIYSYGYHFEVGRIVETEKGNEIVLLNSASYSVSTSKHQGYVRQACNHIESFTVLLNKDARLPFTDYNFVKFFNQYRNIVIESSKKAQRSRKYGDLHLKDAVKAVDDWNKLKTYFPSLTKGIKRLTLPSDVQIKKLNDQDKAERTKERKEKHARIEREENAWLNYQTNYVSRMARCLLRQRQVSYIAEQGCPPQTRLVDEVETSHGARVPMNDAKLFFNAIKRFKDSPKDCLKHFNPGVQKAFKVGNFRLSNLTPKGANIGCHFIAWKEMERFATQMGWQ